MEWTQNLSVVGYFDGKRTENYSAAGVSRVFVVYFFEFQINLYGNDCWLNRKMST